MKRDLLVVAVLWCVLTAIGEALAVGVDIYPLAMSDKGEEIEKAFRTLVIFAVPVFTMVVVVLVYSMLRRRATGPGEDGPAYHGRGPVPVAWFAITTGLTVLVMIYPGITSLSKVIGNEPNPDVLVEVTGVQWTWLISYPDYDVENVRELVLPVDRAVRFEITSLDVLHSFWVPAFLMKIDAVPGKTTVITLRPIEVGSFQTDPLLRVQCAELCGLSHSRMQIPVQVVDERDFEEWAAAQAKPAEPTPGASPAAAVQIAAKNTLFDKDTLEAPAGQPFAIEFDNQDGGVQHNVAIYRDDSAQDQLFMGEIFPGPEKRAYQAPALDAGEYFFRCDVHPATMTGTLTAR